MEIRVLGEVWASNTQGARVKLERKTAALLAYLALEGPTMRSRLVGLLWPESREATARNNLRQLLRRLRGLLGEECVEGGDPLRLREGSNLDVLQLREALAAQDDAKVASFSGRLLEGLRYDEDAETPCEELSEWLEVCRLKLQHGRLEAMAREVLRLEREGQLVTALQWARRLLGLDPTSEASYRHLMRLHHRLGDRAAALDVYRQCQGMVLREFGVELSQETREAARLIERSEAALPTRPAQPDPRLLVATPLVLAGREHSWALMEEAWATRRPMFVDGVAGIGKSRLVTEFARTCGSWILLNARPGDREGGAFRTHMRSLRTVLNLRPEASPQGWVRREMSRLVPQLEEDPLPPPASPSERARLFSAVIEYLRNALRGVDVLIFDDGQYLDQDSAELGVQVHAEFHEEMAAGRFPLIINVFRTSEVRDAWKRQLVHDVLSSGLMARIPVERLDAAAVRVMLRGMGEPRLEQVADEISAYTGGNPLFIVETARHLLQSGTFDGAFPASLPPPGRVGLVIEQRLRRLSREALQLAQVFAVAQTDFSVEMAASVLEVPVGALAEPWRQLEEAHIFQDRWFVHDVVGEVILATLPESVRNVLWVRINDYRHRS